MISEIYFVDKALIIIERLNYKKVELTPFFIFIHGDIMQDIKKEEKKKIKKERKAEHEKYICKRKEQYEKFINERIFSLTKLLHEEFLKVIPELEVGKTYKMTTHIAPMIKRKSKENNIEVISCKKTYKRILFEAIIFFGVKNFLYILFVKDRKEKNKHFYKQFYKITLKKTA